MFLWCERRAKSRGAVPAVEDRGLPGRESRQLVSTETFPPSNSLSHVNKLTVVPTLYFGVVPKLSFRRTNVTRVILELRRQRQKDTKLRPG